MIMNFLPADPRPAEQMLFDMLAAELSVVTDTRQQFATIKEEPAALGHSPEVTALLPLTERAGIVWNVAPDGMIMVRSS